MSKRIFAVVALISFGLILSFVGLELALRAFDAMKPDPPLARGNFWKQHPVYGWLHHPGIEAPWFDDNGEFSLIVKMNSKGLRDVEHEYTKPPGVYRILLLGDSYMEAMQVELEQSFPRLLEKQLNAEGRRVEVINASAADWGTDNQLVYFREEGHKYSPDLVLLAFTTANDIRNNSPSMNLRVPKPNLFKPTFSVTADDRLQYHPAPPLPPGPPPPPWWRASRAISFFMDRIGGPPAILLPPPAPPDARSPTNPHASPAADASAAPASSPAGEPWIPPASKVPTDMLVYAPIPTPEVNEAWRVTKALILQLKVEAEQRGARFAMFLLNGPWAHHEERWGFMMMKDPPAAKTWNRHRPNEVLALFLFGKSITSIDLLKPFEARKNDEPLFFKMDPHWTAAGHRLAAETVARFLVEKHLVPAVGRPAT